MSRFSAGGRIFMTGFIVVVRALFGILGILLLLIGVAVWTGHALSLIPLHMALGLALVALLWVLAALALRARAAGWLVVLALVWGAFLAAFGYAQLGLLPGTNHWIVRVAHLLVGIVGMGLGGILGARIRKAGGGAPPSPVEGAGSIEGARS
jgi:hypothetical protein